MSITSLEEQNAPNVVDHSLAVNPDRRKDKSEVVKTPEDVQMEYLRCGDEIEKQGEDFER